MLVIDTPGPAPCQDMPQCVRLADAAEGVAEDRVQEPVDPLERGPVTRLPVPVILPAVRGEDQAHSLKPEIVRLAFPRLGLGQALEESLGVGGDP